MLCYVLFSLVNSVSRERTLIIGDFNFPNIQWIDEAKLDECNKFVKCINDNFLHQKVHDATRGENVLDLILVTDESMIREVNVGERFGTSDHNVMRFELISSAETEETNLRKTYDYFKADYDLVREELSEIDWNEKINPSNVESTWSNIKAELLGVRDKYVSVKQCKKKKKNCWTTRKVTRCRQAKEKAWKKY